MSIDKKLFKALVGSIGRKAALLLADRSSPYALQPYDLDNGPYSGLTINAAGQISNAFGDSGAATLSVASSLVALPAGAQIVFDHSIFPFDNPYPALFRLQLTFRQMADANGVPQDAPLTSFTGTRAADGTMTLPASSGIYTVSAHPRPNAGFQVTLTQAGFYAISGQSILN